jgi:hypothetical protein
MKKHILLIAGLAALLCLFLAGCAPTSGAIDTTMGADDAAELALFATSNGERDNAVVAGTPLTASPVGTTLYNTTGQLFEIDFNYTVDAATLAGGVLFSYLQSAPAAPSDTLSTATALSYPAPTILANGAGTGCRVFFTLDLSASTSALKLYLKAGVLTAKGGTQKLDGDTDGVMGEPDTDDFVYTYTVSQSMVSGHAALTPVAVVRVENLPSAGAGAYVTVGNAGWLASNAIRDIDNYGTVTANTFLYTATSTNTVGTAANLISVNTDTAKVYKMVAGVWTLVGSTTTYGTDAGNPTQGSIALTTAPVAGEAYKIVIDLYTIRENAAIRGYVHRASKYQVENKAARYATYYEYFDRGYGSTQACTTVAGGTTNHRYIDVTTAGSPFDMATITPANLKVRLGAATTLGYTGSTRTAGADYYTPYTIQNLTLGRFTTNDNNTTLDTTDDVTKDTAVTAFRIYLPEEVNTVASGQVWISPNVLTEDVSITGVSAGFDANGKRFFATVVTTNDGYLVKTF